MSVSPPATRYRLVSADSHVNEPPDLWRSRVPAHLVDRAPRIERLDKGDAWIVEGALDPINFGKNCCAGLPVEQRVPWVRWDGVRRGGYDPAARLAEQDTDGVDAEILYPTPRLSNAIFWHTADREWHLACIRAYNDWLAEFCAHDPARLWGVALLPNAGVDDAVAELERTMAMPGMRGVQLGQYPHGGLDIAPDDDRVWAAAAERGVPVSIHVGFATAAVGEVARGQMRGDMRFFEAPVRAQQFIMTGVFDRFPGLQLVLVEVDSAWVPYVREQMDDRYRRDDPRTRAKLARLPGDYFSTNISTTFITDAYGVRNRHEIGVTQMLWSSDHPHGGSDWPESHAAIDAMFAGVPEDERQAILAANAVRLYGVDG